MLCRVFNEWTTRLSFEIKARPSWRTQARLCLQLYISIYIFPSHSWKLIKGSEWGILMLDPLLVDCLKTTGCRFDETKEWNRESSEQRRTTETVCRESKWSWGWDGISRWIRMRYATYLHGYIMKRPAHHNIRTEKNFGYEPSRDFSHVRWILTDSETLKRAMKARA